MHFAIFKSGIYLFRICVTTISLHTFNYVTTRLNQYGKRNQWVGVKRLLSHNMKYFLLKCSVMIDNIVSRPFGIWIKEMILKIEFTVIYIIDLKLIDHTGSHIVLATSSIVVIALLSVTLYCFNPLLLSS